MLVHELMTLDPACCTPETKISDAARVMAEMDCGAIPVCDASRKLVGIVTDRDITCRAIAERRNLHDVAVREIMTTPVVTVAENDDLYVGMQLMKDRKVRRLPVLRNDQVIGMLSLTDIALHVPVPVTGEILQKVSRGALAHT